MNDKERATRVLPFIQAMADGKEIEFKSGDKWITATVFYIDDLWRYPSKYRVKPSPTYRPFRDRDECWSEILKHQPVGWIKSKDGSDGYYHIDIILPDNDGELVIKLQDGDSHTPIDLSVNYVFADGEYFGIKEQ